MSSGGERDANGAVATTGRTARYGSPRSAERPMAFTAWEFARGALLAWLGFNLLAPFVVVATGIAIDLVTGSGSGLAYALPTLLIAPTLLVPWSLGALLFVGAPAALVLGLALRRRSERARHLTGFALLGATIGAATTIAYTWYSSIPPPGVTVIHYAPPPTLGELVLRNLPLVLLLAGTTATAVSVGWRLTVRWALRDDARSVVAASAEASPSRWCKTDEDAAG